MLPCILFEDEDLLAIHKPAGLNTHAPDPFAGEGIYDWLRHREPRWATLAIIHRLDKDTSGVLVFAKSKQANQSLTRQFTERTVRKKYLCLTDRPFPKDRLVKSKITRVGEHYASGPNGESAETWFRRHNTTAQIPKSLCLEAEPLTGRTHQIRVHAAENGFPILGDTLYGGSPFPRLCLHSAELTLRHPSTGKEMTFQSPVDFTADARLALRTTLIDLPETNAYRIVHGASDNRPDLYVDRFGDFLLSQSSQDLNAQQTAYLKSLSPAAVVYHKILNRQVRRTSTTEAEPTRMFGEQAPERFVVRENGIQFELSFQEGYSSGLFLDQRDNRRRLLTGHIAAGFSLFDPVEAHSSVEVLNTFAYTCGFSVCAAKAGMKTTSLDLSKKYLEWGRRNFARNGIDAAAHDFIYGDVFDWLRRLAKKDRSFDIIVLDPPTFSQSKEHGVFRAEKDYGKLVSSALPLLKSGGVLLASTNASDWRPPDFLNEILEAIQSAGRRISKQHYVPQPPDFPISRSEPAYLKTVWLQIK